jgi:O-antigen/teichoic acid export membrane protein
MITKFHTLKNHQGFMKYFRNTSWLFGEKILRMIVGLFVGIWVARYLGPSQFGLFSYAQSFVGLFTAFATLGLDGIVVRELVHDESRRDELIGTAFWLKLMGAFGVLFILSMAVNFTSNDSYTNTLVFIIASATIFQSFNVVDMYFQSKVMGKYIVYANVISLLLSSIVKVILILNHASLIAFAWTIVFDNVILALGFIYYYIKMSHHEEERHFLRSLTFNKVTAKKLLKDSWPLILSGMAVGFGMRLDQVLLKEMISVSAVGIYAAGVRLAEPLVIIPMVITQSIFPKLMLLDDVKDKDKIITIFRIIFYFLLFIALLILLLSNTIILFLYGKEYVEAGIVLGILIFSIPFTFLNILTSKLLLKNNYQTIILQRQILLLLLNVILNLLMIPKFGIVGAAFATTLVDLIIGLLVDYFSLKTRELFFIKINAIFFTNLMHTKVYR